MTCSKHLGRLLQVSCLGLIGALTIVGCGGSDETKKPDGGPEVNVGGAGGSNSARVTVAPSALALGSVVVGSTSSSAAAVTITNTGTAPATLAPSVTGPFAISSNNCAAVAAGTTCTISVVFTPTAVGPASGVLVVTSTMTVQLTGTGIEASNLSVNDRIDLGQVLVGAPVSGVVTVTAMGAVSGLSCTTSGTEIAADPAKPCPATLAAGGTCAFGFTFTAGTAGTKSASVVCTATGLPLPAIAQINALAVTPPVLAFQAPSTVALTSQVGVATSAVSFNLVNSGGSASGTLVVTPSGETADYTVDNQCIVVQPAAFCKINVTFKPTVAGTRNLTLTVTDPTNPKLALVATVNGTALATPVLGITGAATDFGSVVAGSSSTALTFTVTNSGGVDTGAVTVASSDTQFAIATNTCNGVSLGAAKTCTFVVTFKPTSAGPASANLTASATGIAAGQLPVKGVGTGAAALSLAPSSLDFGGIIVGTTSATKTFKVTNSGQNAAGALEVVKNDSTSSVGGGSQFTYTTTCGAAGLAPSATCDVVVTFAPLQTGSASATITVRTVDRSVSSQAGTLLGLGLGTADLTVGCGDGFSGGPDFTSPGTVVSKTSNPITCQVKNTASTASGALTIALTGDFAVGTNNCAAANLQANTTCTFTVTFSPTVKGTRTGVLSVTSANGGSASQQATGKGLGIIEIVEVNHSGDTVDPQPYDFEQQTVGIETGDSVQLTLNVYVRANVGNINVTSAFGTPAEFVLDATDCATYSGTVPQASTDVLCTMYVDFKPLQRSLRTGTVTVSGANGTTDSATMKGTGTGPLTLAPSPAQFTSIGKGQASDKVIITLTNNGATTINNLSYTINDASGQFIVVSDDLTGVDVAQDDTATLGLVYIPSAIAAAAGSITVTGTRADATGTETATVNLVGNGVQDTTLTVTMTNNGTFADTFAGAASAPLTVTVANSAGSQPSGSITFEITNDSTVDFTKTASDISSSTLQGTCEQGASNPVAAGANCTEFIWFTPDASSAMIARAGTLKVKNDGAVIATFALKGNALPQLLISPAGTSTAPTNIGTAIVAVDPAPSVTFTVTNRSRNDIAAGNLTFAMGTSAKGPNYAGLFIIDTSASNTCNNVVAKNGGTCTFKVSAVATDTSKLGPFFSKLTVTATDNDAAQFVTADVTATVQLPPLLGFTTPTDVQTSELTRNIGAVEIGSYSAPIKYTVKNTGGSNSGRVTAVLYKKGDTVAQAKPSRFAIDASACTALGETGLAPGATCNVLITAHPTVNAPSDTNLLMEADLVVTAASDNITYTDDPDATELRRTIQAQATVAATSPYIVDDTTGLAPADFGLIAGTYSTYPATYTLTLALHNPSQTALTLNGDDIFDETKTNVGAHETMVASKGSGTCDTDGVVAASGKCTFVVTWSIASAGALAGYRSDVVALLDADGDPLASIDVFGFVGSPITFSLSRASLDLGSVLLTQASQQETVVITNTGDFDSTTNLSVALDPTGGVVHTSGCTTAKLAPLASCTMTIWVVPTGTDDSSGTVTVKGNAGVVESDPIAITWTPRIDAALAISSDPIEFDDQAVLSTAANTATITVTNGANSIKTGALSIAVLDDAGKAAPDFIITGGTCLDIAFIDTNDDCDIIVQFTPVSLSPAIKTGTLTVSATPGGTATVDLSGTALAALSVTGASGDAGTIQTASDGTKSLAVDDTPLTTTSVVTLTFTNAAGSPTTGLLNVVVSGTNAADFRITNDLCTGLKKAGGATCTVEVTFAPKVVGTAKTATITVSGNPGNSAAIKLTGNATVAP